MKFVLYAIAVVGILVGVVIMASGGYVFQQTVGAILILVGTTSLGFSVVVNRLERLLHRDD